MRSKGTGQVIPVKEGKWRIRWFVRRDERGKRVYESLVVEGTRRDAQKRLSEKLGARDFGKTTTKPPRQTVNALLDHYLTTLTCSSRSREGLRWLLATYIRPKLGALRLDEVKPTDVRVLVAEMNADEYSRCTIQKALTPLRAAFKQAVEDDRLRKSPIPANKDVLPKKTARVKRALTESEWRTLRAALRERVTEAEAEIPKATTRRSREAWAGEVARRTQACAFYDVLVLLQLRPGELRGLAWSDVDLEAGTLEVCRAATFDVGEVNAKGERARTLRVGHTKTPGSVRPLPLGPVLVATLRAHRAAQAERAMKLGASYDRAADLVFANDVGGVLDESNLRQGYWLPACKKAGIHKRTYDLRHTGASVLIDHGESPNVVTERLGHTSTTTTFDNYVHTREGAQAKASALLEALLLQ